MKRVCVVTNMHQAFDTRIFKKECVSLAKKYEVYLVAPNVVSQTVSYVNIVGVSFPGNRVKRLLSANKLYPILKEINADIYHFHDPGLLRLGVKVKNKLNKKIIFDSHEDSPQTIKDKGWIPSFLRYPLYYLSIVYEKVNIKKYDAIISVTPGIVERLKKINNNTYQITNYPILKKVEDLRKWNPSICYTGGIDSYWMIHNVIKAIEGIDVTLVLAGKVRENYLSYLKSLPGWKNVDYRGVVPYSDISNLVQNCSATLAIHSFKDPNVGYTEGTLGNTKFFEGMLFGLPIISSSHRLWKEIVYKYDCGICVDPENVSEIKEAIGAIVNNTNRAKEMGSNARFAVENEYNWSTQETILFSIYESLINKR